jgi:syntaxin 16
LLIASGAVQLKGQEGMSDLDEDLRAAVRSFFSTPFITEKQNLTPYPHVKQTSNQTTLLFDQDLQSQDDDERDLLARDHQLTEIARSISTLAELFRDLGALVIDQGSLLDSIEYNIQNVERDVVDAGKELVSAEGYQKRTGRRKCIFLLLLVIFGLVLVLIFKPRRTHGAFGSGSGSGTGSGSGEASNAPLGSVTAAVAGAVAGSGSNGGLPPLPIDDVTLNPLGAGGGMAGVLESGSRARSQRQRQRRIEPRIPSASSDSRESSPPLPPDRFPTSTMRSPLFNR